MAFWSARLSTVCRVYHLNCFFFFLFNLAAAGEFLQYKHGVVEHYAQLGIMCVFYIQY